MVVSSAVLSTVGRQNLSAPHSHQRKTTIITTMEAARRYLKEVAILVLAPCTTQLQCLTSRIMSEGAAAHDLRPWLAAQSQCTSRRRTIGTQMERVFTKCPAQLTFSRCLLKKPNSSTQAPSHVITCRHRRNSWLWQLILLLSSLPLGLTSQDPL